MAIALTVDPDKAPTGCRVPTIVPALEFEPGKSYELPDEQAQALLALPDGPFMRTSLKAARAQATAEQQSTETEQRPATAENAQTESEAT